MGAVRHQQQQKPPQVILNGRENIYADDREWRKVISRYRKPDYHRRPSPLDWVNDNRVVDFFVDEFRAEVDKAFIRECIIDRPTMHKMVEAFDDVGVFPALTVGTARQGKRPAMHVIPVTWKSSDKKIDLALRLAFAQSEIPDPDERLPALLGKPREPGALVERCRRLAVREDKSLYEFCRDVYNMDVPGAQKELGYLQSELGVWLGGVGWFNHRKQDAQIAQTLQNNHDFKKIWWVGVYNGEELGGLIVDLREKHGIRRQLEFVGTDLFTPNPERIMFARTKQVVHFFGENALDNHFEVCGTHCCKPKKELLEQMTLKHGDVTESHETDCDIVVFNGVLQTVPSKRREALDNIFAGVISGGFVYSENSSYSEQKEVRQVGRVIEGYVDSRSELEFVERDSRKAEYVIRKT